MESPRLLLASASPRRSDLLRGLGYDFDVKPTDVEEVLPKGLPPERAASYLAELKARVCEAWLTPQTVVITADSVVLHEGEVLNKPTDLDAARAMLERLCGSTHTVITGVCILSEAHGSAAFEVFEVTTQVTLAMASATEIDYYLGIQPPLDKAGSYGIQDWIGLAKATRIEGSYTNVMGLPTAEVYRALRSRGVMPERRRR